MRKVLRSVGVHLVDLVITDRDFHVWSLGDPNDGSRGPTLAIVGDWDGDGIDTGGLRT